ncbi:UNVERIFIED_CONTAM: hypothetical protein HDU68_002989 [Siphonaria sp. JEL0065]|nr:hypothetical protein HDU68_002989 [Siphonaria sp. JEL0065]
MDLREKIGHKTQRSTQPSSSATSTRIAARLGGGPSGAFAKRTIADSIGGGGGRAAARAVEPSLNAATALIPPVDPSIRVLNLDPKASAADVQTTFAEFGVVGKCVVSYDAATATGIAEISYKDRTAVKKAIDTYNGVVADGRTLKVEEVNAAPRGLQIAGRIGAAAKVIPTATPISVPVLKTSVGSVVVGGMYSDRVEESQQAVRRIPITERLGNRTR